MVMNISSRTWFFRRTNEKQSNNTFRLKKMWLFLKENETNILSDLNSIGVDEFCFKHIAIINEWEFYAFISEARKFKYLEDVISFLVDESFMETVNVNGWECTKFSILPEQVREVIDVLKIEKEKKILLKKQEKIEKSYSNNYRL